MNKKVIIAGFAGLLLIIGLGVTAFVATRSQSQNIGGKAYNGNEIVGTGCSIPAGGTTCQGTYTWNFDAWKEHNMQILINGQAVKVFWHAPIWSQNQAGCKSDCGCKDANDCENKCGYPGCTIHQQGSEAFTMECGKSYSFQIMSIDTGQWIGGNTITAPGCSSATVGCNQTCNGSSILCNSPYVCTGGKCVNSSCSTEPDCVCKTNVGCNQTCNGTTILCNSPYVCTNGKCVNSSCSTEPDCVCKTTIGCNETCDATHICDNTKGLSCIDAKCKNTACSSTQDATCKCPTPPAACQKVEMSETFDKVRVGDPVVFTGYGNLGVGDATDSINKINFRVFKDGVVDKDQTVNTTLDTTKSTSTTQVYRASYTYTISSAATYRVVIKVHRVKGDVWLE